MRLLSEAADRFRGNEVEGAIALLRAALLTENRAETHRYLSLAYAQKRDYKQALSEIGEAVTLDPHSPENYHVRSLLWRMTGDYVRAALDYHQCTEIDPNYRDIDAIRRGAEVMKSRLTDFRILHWGRSVNPRDPSLRDMVREILDETQRRRFLFERPSCALPCPAYCCYFEYDMVDHRVIIEEDQLPAVRHFLAERGLRERDYIGRSRRKVSRNGVRDYVFHPKRSRRLVDRDLLPSVPRNLGYNRIVWASEKARACMFLTQQGCLIHEVGEKPGLDACRSFMCLTGFVFLTLRYLGVHDGAMVEGRAMGELNDLAAKSLLVLYRGLYGRKELTDLESSFHGALVKAVESEGTGDAPGFAQEVEACLRYQASLNQIRKQALRDVERDLRALFRTG